MQIYTKVNILSKSKENNQNLFINSNFKNPVNQRGLTNLTATKNKEYFIDRWFITIGNSASIVQDGIQVNANNSSWGFTQTLSLDDIPIKGKQITFSAKISVTSGLVDLRIGTTPAVVSSENCSAGQTKILKATTIISENNATNLSFIIFITTNTVTNFIVEWAKLEYGDTATEFVPYSYQDELIKCQYYCQLLASKKGNLIQWWATSSSSNNDVFFLPIVNSLRTKPTFVYNNLSYFYLRQMNNLSINYVIKSLTVENIYRNNDMISIRIYLDGATFSNLSSYYLNTNSDNIICYLDSEIY